LKEKQRIFFVKILIYMKHVIQKDQKIEMKIHINIDIEMNVIFQRFTLEQNMSLMNIKFLKFI